jgi:hypothetical protein
MKVRFLSELMPMRGGRRQRDAELLVARRGIIGAGVGRFPLDYTHRGLEIPYKLDIRQRGSCKRFYKSEQPYAGWRILISAEQW